MSQRIEGKLCQIGQGYYGFWCPGCKDIHSIPANSSGQPKPNWQWNGSWTAPTFSPSVNVNPNYPQRQCHFFVTGGRIAYQGDCWHELKGQTVDLPDIMDSPASDFYKTVDDG